MGKRSPKKDDGKMDESTRKQLEAVKAEERALRRILKQTKRELGLPVDDDDDDDTTAGPSKSITTEDAPDDDNDDVDVAPPTAGPSKRFEPTEDTPDDPPEDGYPASDEDDGGPTPPGSPTAANAPDSSTATALPHPPTAPPAAPSAPTYAAPPSALPSSHAGAAPAIRPIVPTIDGATWHTAQTSVSTATGPKKPPKQVLSFKRSRYASLVNTIVYWAYQNPARWSNVLGVYFQMGDRSPLEVSGSWQWASGLNGFQRHWRLLDWRKANGQSLAPFAIPCDDKDQNILYEGSQKERAIFEEAVSRWGRDEGNFQAAREVLRATFWTNQWMIDDDWHVVDNILKMPEGPEKAAKMAAAKAESPLFFAACLEDTLCGTTREEVQHTRPDGEVIEDEYEIRQLATGPLRIHKRRNLLGKRRRVDDENTMNTYSANGRPTQFHAVPPEERAYDENGKQLPWALEWPDDHPNARGQKRRAVETGPFGKSMRRKGSSRATRTATPAKKESSAVDGFLRGLEEDKRRAELYNEGRESIVSNTALPQDSTAATTNREPKQVMLYGFSDSSQWAAIDFYEKASGGMICEDYDRHPPPEARRIPTVYASPAMVRRRALTPLEKKLSMSYKGGKAWIRVTFDSAEAAERACYSSPHIVQGHWVYAEMYADGIIPNNDEPIPCRREDRQPGLTTPVQPSHIPSHRTTQSLGPAFTRNMQAHQPGTAATIPRSFTSNTSPHAGTSQRLEANSESPSTASSATATAPATTPEAGSTALHQRGSDAQGRTDRGTTTSLQSPQGNTQYMRHFPDVPRTVLRPASEAFLPQPNFTQKTLKYLENLGLIPGDVIGHLVPRTESGEFDGANASFYWRFFFWLDTTFGTDICGLKED